MSKNTYIVIGLIVVLAILGFVFLRQRGGNEALAPTGEQQTETQAGVPTSTGTQASGEVGAPVQAGTKVKGATVTYTDSGFSPSTVTINKGETVTFKNSSSRDFWPASAVHPTHTIYPEFDAKKAISAGGSYSFTFTRVGSWKYHNHLNPSLTGTITVQ